MMPDELSKTLDFRRLPGAVVTDVLLQALLSDEQSSTPADERLIITPLSRECLTPLGYDLRIGRTALVGGEYRNLTDAESFVIPAGTTALITTMEEVVMPPSRWLTGLIFSKVSQVSRGLSHISTTVDPDWSGPLLIAVHNVSASDIEMRVGDGFCTLLFLVNRTPSVTPCGKPPGRSDVLLTQQATMEANLKTTATRRGARARVLSTLAMFAIVSIGLLLGSRFSLGVSVVVGYYVAELLKVRLRPEAMR